MNGRSYSDFFDDDFEVVYEEDLPEIHINGDSDDRKDRCDRSYDDYDDDEDPIDDDEDEEYDSRGESGRRRGRDSGAGKEKERRSGRDRQEDGRRRSRSRSRHSVLSPVKKTAQTGARAAARLIQMVCRAATLVLIAVITFILASHFLEGLFTYGNPATAVAERNYIMAAYVAFALFLLLFEAILFLWALTGPRVAENGRRSFQSDTGRGMFSFVLVGAGSILAYVLAGLIPGTPAPLTGLAGAVEIYGSLSGTLVPLCIAGVISCILRKLFSR